MAVRDLRELSPKPREPSDDDGASADLEFASKVIIAGSRRTQLALQQQSSETQFPGCLNLLRFAEAGSSLQPPRYLTSMAG